MFSLLYAAVLFILYVQFSPSMGNVWYRKDSDGNGFFSFGGLFDLIIFPLKNLQMWYPSMWDINIYIWLSLSYIIFNCNKFFLTWFVL